MCGIECLAADIMRQSGGECAVVMLDLDSGYGVCYGDKRFRSASLIKVDIMAEAYRQKNNDQLSFAELLELREEYRVGGAGKLSAQPAGAQIALGELLRLMIVDSDNAATNMLIDRLGMANINRFIKVRGAKETTLQRKMMDFEAAKRGFQNYTSATDMVDIIAKIHRGQLVDAAASVAMYATLTAQNDRDGIAAVMPKGAIYAGKSGELENYNSDCGIVRYNGRACALCIICENFADNTSALQSLRQLAARALEKWQAKTQAESLQSSQIVHK